MGIRICILLILAPGLLLAQEAPQIGYVDMKRLLENAPQVVSSREQLDQEFRPRDDAILADESRLARMEQELATAENLGDEERAAQEREIRNLRRSIERRREDLREEFNFRRNEAARSVRDEIDIAVQTVARQQGYDLVLSSPVVYASDAINITDQILEFLRSEYSLTGNGSSESQ